jgi:hypothetical protein
MRRSSVILASLLALLVFATVAWARLTPADSDGTLSIKRGRGDINITLTGAMIGRVDRGRLTVTDLDPLDDQVPQITHVQRSRSLTSTTTVYFGRKIRFRMLDGTYKLKLHGAGIHVSAVGRGFAWLKGDEHYVKVGVYSLNGGPYKLLPYEKTKVQIFLSSDGG